MADNVQVRGIDEMIRSLDSMGKKGERTVNTALREGGNIILQEAKRNTPVDDGDLREALKVSSVKNEAGVPFVSIGVGRGRSAKYVFYAHMVHNGHRITAHGLNRNQPARPFMTMAKERKQQQAIDRMGEIMADGMGLNR